MPWGAIDIGRALIDMAVGGGEGHRIWATGIASAIDLCMQWSAWNLKCGTNDDL